MDQVEYPIWITAQALAAAPRGPIANVLARAVLAPGVPEPAVSLLAATIAKALTERPSGRSCVVVDALDELPKDSNFADVIRELLKLPVLVLLTCRTMQWKSRKDEWPPLDELEIAPFDPERQRQLADAFFGREKPPELLLRLLRGPYGIRHALRTPLLMTFACLLSGSEELAQISNCAQLYALIVVRLLRGKWRNPASLPAWVGSDGNFAIVQKLIVDLAWRAFSASPEKNVFTRSQWDDSCAAIFGTAWNRGKLEEQFANLLDELTEVHGFFVPGRESGQETWSFVHRTIMEFLTARKLSSEADWLGVVRAQEWKSPAWSEVLAFLGGLSNDLGPINLGPLIADLVQAERLDDDFHTCFQLGTRLAGASASVPKDVEDDMLAAGLAWLDSDESDLPAATLANLGERAIEPLMRAARERTSQSCGQVLDVFGLIGSEKPLGLLLEKTLSKEIWERIYAASAIGRIGSAKKIKVDGIGEMHTVEALLNLTQDRVASVRATAARALRRIGTAEALKTLLARAGSDDDKVSEWATDALGIIGSEAAVEGLVTLLYHGKSFQQWGAAEALGAIRSPAAVPPLIAASTTLTVETQELAFAAAQALGNIATESAVAHLIKLAESSNPLIRYVVVEGLGGAGLEMAVPVLAKLSVAGPFPDGQDLRGEAFQALGKIGTKEALDHLVAVYESGDMATKTAVMGGMAFIRSERVEALALAALDSGDEKLNAQALAALAQFDKQQTIDALLRMDLRHLPQAGLDALARSNDPRAEAHLREIMKSRFSTHVRQQAHKSLMLRNSRRMNPGHK